MFYPNIRSKVILFSLGIIASALPIRAGILALTPENSVVNTFAGTGRPEAINGHHHVSGFNWPTGITSDHQGNLFVADSRNHLIRRISRMGTVSTFAGRGVPGFSDGPSEEAMFNRPESIAMDMDGNIFVADAENFRIRKITPTGQVSTLAGNEFPGHRDSKGKFALFVYPSGITVAPDGTIYVADRGSHTIRKISTEGVVTTIGGNGTAGYQDGMARDSKFHDPINVALDRKGYLYVTDSGNHTIRKISPKGHVTSVAGNRIPGFKDGKASQARLHGPTGIAIDAHDNLYVSDSNNSRIRLISPKGNVRTLAGNGSPGNINGPGGVAQFNLPGGLHINPGGDVFVADSGNHQIRTITPGQREIVQEKHTHHDHG